MSEIQKKVVIITEASGGLEAATARRLGSQTIVVETKIVTA